MSNSTKITPVFKDLKPEDVQNHLKEVKKAVSDNGSFPVSVFPKTFADLIDECKKSLNFPTEYTGTAMLVSISTMIGTTAVLKVKNSWYEYASVYAALIGNPGANKSHPLDLIFTPHLSIDKKEIDRYSKEYEEYEDYLSLSKKDRKEVEKVEKPILRKTVLHSFTPEVLHQRLHDNLKGCTVVSDELATFLELMNNYSKGDMVSVYLSFWSNKPTSIDRVGKPIPLYIQRPYLNIIGTLQPRILSKLFPVDRVDNGLFQRFLFTLSNAKKQPISDNELDEVKLEAYNKYVLNYYKYNVPEIDENTGKLNSKVFNWSNEAKKYFYNWQKNNTEKVNENADNLKGEILSKFDIHFIRLALILQIMQDENTNQIGMQAVEGADRLCEYFINNAFKVLNILQQPLEPKESLPKEKFNFYKALPPTFTTADANEVGKEFGFNEKYVQRFISNTDFFIRVSQGNYEKLKN